MNKLKKERSIARQLFTRAKNCFIEECKTEDRNLIRNSFKYLAEKAENLFGVDLRIKEQWLLEDDDNETEFLDDCETAESYKKEWIELENRYENLMQQAQNQESRYDSASVISTNNKRALRLPKLELTKFDGNAKNWLGFWSSFKKIHNDQTIDNDDKMAYLVQSMTANSGAQELVNSFPPCGENYSQAIEQLKSRYARDELLIEIYVRELLALVLQQAKQSNSITISSLYDKLKTQLRALEALGVTSEKYAAMLYPLVESALPADILRVWERQRIRDNGTDVLNNLLEFIKTEVESEERIQITRQSLTTVTDNERIPTAACLIAGNMKPTTSTNVTHIPQIQCIWCDKTSHGSHECYKVQKISMEARKEIVSKKKACYVCLKVGHHGNKCKSYTTCILCQKRHAVFLCPETIRSVRSTATTDSSELIQQSVDNNVSLPTPSVTLLQTLLVKIGTETVRAFIDTGAQRSYIRNDIVRKLHLTYTGEEVLRHHLFGGVETKDESHQVFTLTIKSMAGEFSFNMSALNKDQICGYVPRIRSDASIIQKLKENNICIYDVGSNPPDIGLLIGADYAGKIMTGSVVKLHQDLYAIQTKLGWTVQGIIENRNNSVIASVSLIDDISQLWKLEIIGIEDPEEHTCRKRTEMEALEDFNRNVYINKKLRGMKKLETIVDDRGLMRVKTRLTMSDEDINFKYPILLDGKHPVVVKLVEQRHLIYLHAGLYNMTSILRNEFWIVGCKKLVRNIISKCIVCKRYKVKNYETSTAPLPRDRVKDAAVFQVTGVDAAGPLMLNTGEKCWLILFTCEIYRAIHLELVMSMSTECFLQALRRFIARRGRAQTIYSDNGTNFVGAENQLSNINWDSVKEFSTTQRIKWIFNPPAAPWWGGWWERLIQMVKQLLRRNLGKAILTFTELETLVCDIESIINARPLTYISEDDTLLPLTPASFLHSLPGTEVPDIDTIDAGSLRMRHRYVQKLRTDLRQRFRNEYLALLVSGSQNSNQETRVGDIVLVEAESKRVNWPLGIVMETYPGRDGQVRVAKVKTSYGLKIRPVQRLYPLEIGSCPAGVATHDRPKVQPEMAPRMATEVAPEVLPGISRPQTSRRGRPLKVPQRLDL